MPRPEAGELADELTDPVVEQAKPEAPAVEPVVEAQKPEPKPGAAKPAPEPEAQKPEPEAAAAVPAVQVVEVSKRMAVTDIDLQTGSTGVRTVFKKGDLVRGERAARLAELFPADVVVIR